MKRILLFIVLASVSIALSACASTQTPVNTIGNDHHQQISKAPLSRHDRLWNPSLQDW